MGSVVVRSGTVHLRGKEEEVTPLERVASLHIQAEALNGDLRASADTMTLREARMVTREIRRVEATLLGCRKYLLDVEVHAE